MQWHCELVVTNSVKLSLQQRLFPLLAAALDSGLSARQGRRAVSLAHRI
jgi:hypothetical protein